MKELVLVEFIANGSDRDRLQNEISLLNDFKSEGLKHYPVNGHIHMEEYYVFYGTICSQYASVIKLQNPFLAERMRISYISDEMKDKYRNGN